MSAVDDKNMPIQNGQLQPDDVQKLIAKNSEYEQIIENYKLKDVEIQKTILKKDEQLQENKTKITDLEKKLSDVEKAKLQQSKESEEFNSLKVRSEDTLTKAKHIIFENTKVIKNQELQIEALSQQIESLKDVVAITKDLLEIRNLEVKQLENKIRCIEEKTKAEKERQDLIHKKLETMIRHNGELKREYETQLCLFAALRERYNERELAKDVVDQLKGDKVAEKATSTAGKAPDDTNIEKTAAIIDQAPSALETAPVTMDKGKDLNVEKAENVPATLEENVAQAATAPMSVEAAAVTVENALKIAEKALAAVEKPAAIEQALVPEPQAQVQQTGEKAPVATEKVPAAMEKVPAAVETAPAAVQKAPAAPAVIEIPPAAPAVMEIPPAAVAKVPAVVEKVSVLEGKVSEAPVVTPSPALPPGPPSGVAPGTAEKSPLPENATKK